MMVKAGDLGHGLWGSLTKQQEAREEGRDEGFHQGREQGTHEEKLRTAANLKQLGVSIEIITQATDLSVEEIEGL